MRWWRDGPGSQSQWQASRRCPTATASLTFERIGCSTGARKRHPRASTRNIRAKPSRAARFVAQGISKAPTRASAETVVRRAQTPTLFKSFDRRNIDPYNAEDSEAPLFFSFCCRRVGRFT